MTGISRLKSTAEWINKFVSRLSTDRDKLVGKLLVLAILVTNRGTRNWPGN
jgi:hypothetical protein